jgi:hypothetical protein
LRGISSQYSTRFFCGNLRHINERIAQLFEFAAVDGRRVVASFDGGAIMPDAGALLGQTDRATHLTERFDAFTEGRTPAAKLRR